MSATHLQMAGSPGNGLPGKPMGVLPAAQMTWGAQAAEFSTDVCDCCDDLSICVSQRDRRYNPGAGPSYGALTPLLRMQCKTLFCPCMTFSEIAQHVTGEA